MYSLSLFLHYKLYEVLGNLNGFSNVVQPSNYELNQESSYCLSSVRTYIVKDISLVSEDSF